MPSLGGNHRGWRWFLPLLLGATAALKLLFAWIYPGFLTGDDLEIVETAARYATGLAYNPWPIRSMLHPLGLAWPAMQLGVLGGLDSPHWLTLLACLPTVLLSTLGIGLLYRLALALSWSEAEARVAVFLFALHYLPLTYGSTPYPRPISTCLLLAAFLLVAEREGSRGAALTAGILAAAGMTVRWSEGLMLAPLLAFAAWRARDLRRPVILLAGFVGGTILFVGAFDAWSWGRPFASLIEFTRYLRDPNLGGTRPRVWSWYGTMVLQWAGPIFVLLSAVAWRDRRSRIPLAIALSAVILFSLSPLKQLRYLQVVIPFLALAAALGWSRLHGGTDRQRWLASAALFLAVPLGLERTWNVLSRKSDAALVAARVLSQIRSGPRRVVLEQKWAYGDRLYLGNMVEIRDLTPRTPLLTEVVRDAANGADAVALYASDVDEGVARMLSDAGLRPCATFARNRSPEVTLYLPSPRPCPEPEAP